LIDSTYAAILNRVTEAVYEIDMDCKGLVGGVENGLVNVKAEFQDRAKEDTGKKLTEELLIAWLLRQKLAAQSWRVMPDEVPYPNDHLKRCDLVVDIAGGTQLWLELKMAWKAWFNCVGEPSYFNRPYQTYLDGRGRSHSFRHDLEKLSVAALPSHYGRVVCLVGTDHQSKPMDDDVAKIVSDFRSQETCWQLVAEKHWPDRRNKEFRINVWCWLLTRLNA
jgi:hypothetical protein